jgi:ABC-type lipoprotein export system ATPase subunit
MNKTPIQDEIDKLLDLFDGDNEAVIQAIRNRSVPIKSTNELPEDKKVLIEVDSLQKIYKIGRQKVTAINNISLKIGEGEIVALVGPSGSGKSTLLQLMGGLDKPTSGTITVDGNNLSKMSDAKLSEFRGRTIGFVFQFFYLQPYLKVKTNLAVPGIFAHVRPSESKQRAEQLAKAVSIDNRLEHYPKEISGGQIQRTAIARALLNNPKIILADEPTGNLDSQTSDNIVDLLEKIRADYNTTIVIATHDSNIARRVDRVINIQDGAAA